jgi:UMF1 family MFS transporter
VARADAESPPVLRSVTGADEIKWGLGVAGKSTTAAFSLSEGTTSRGPNSLTQLSAASDDGVTTALSGVESAAGDPLRRSQETVAATAWKSRSDRTTRSRHMTRNLGFAVITSIGDRVVQPTHEPSVYDAAGESRVATRAPARERWSWAFYDFANTIFSMNVASLYFVVWLVDDLGASNTLYAVTNAIASALVVISIPVLGAISDARRRRKWWVVGFTIAACLGCAAIGVLGQTSAPITGEHVLDATSIPGWNPGVGDLKWVLLAFIIANFAYQAAQPFYNAMLPELVPAPEQGRMSGIGVATGYVGSIVGVLLVMPFFRGGLPIIGALGDQVLGALRSIPYTEHAGRVSTFVPTALLFLAFSLPLIVFCRDRDPVRWGARVEWRRAFHDVLGTLRDARKHPGALRFIITTFVYQDAVGTIVSFMTLYAVKAVGFDDGSETTLFLVLTIPAIFGSYFYGRLTDRVGPKRALSMTLAIWVLLLALMVVAPGKGAFWLVGFAIGLNFGGVNAIERPLLLSLVPDVSAGKYFSLLLLSARAAAIIGPLIWSVTVDGLEQQLGTAVAYRVAVCTVALMFALAWWLLRGVPDRRPGAPAVAT